jgi:YVTN family beta-propeller protein
MILFPKYFGQTRARLVQAGVAFVATALIAGCGSAYRPVVTPITPSSPAGQPESFAAVVSAPSPTAPGIATIIDYSGDTVMAESPIGPGPSAFTVDEGGDAGYTINSDGTLTNFQISTNLQAKNLLFSTLPTTAQPVNLFSPVAGLWIADLYGNNADDMTGYPESLSYAIPVATTPVTVVGPGTSAQRYYAISQNFDAPSVNSPNGVACNISPRNAPVNGEATPIEVSSNTPDAPIAVGKCPVYAVSSADRNRFFVLNRGDDTITVINSQNNTLDTCTGLVNQNGQPVTCHPSLPLSQAAGLTGSNVPAIAGPVYAEFNSTTNQLVVADYDGNSISVIDVSLDEYGNDSPTFGTTFTIPVGKNPASVTVLNDGSRAYTANQTDGTVTIVNLTSHTVEKTLPVIGNPRTVVSTQNSTYGKVYVASPNSPYLTIIQTGGTNPDIVDTSVLVEGNIVDVRVSTQDAVKGNSNTVSRVPGFGEPCYLPPSLLATDSSLTLKACQTLP